MVILVQLTTRDTASRDTETLVRFAREILDARWTPEFVRYKYFQNPAGPFYGRCAEFDGRAMGFYGNTPVRLKLGNQIVIAAQAVDALVAPEVRRSGLFATLAEQTYEQMDQAGVALTYAFPNPISHRGFLERLAWTDVGEVPQYVKVLDSGALSRLGGRKGPKAWIYRAMLAAVGVVTPRQASDGKPGVQVREVDAFDARFDRLWQQVAETFPIAVVRDAGYLTWRYVQNPLQRYTILAGERGEDLAGCAVLAQRDTQEGGAAALTELLVTPGDEQTGLALLNQAAARARDWGCVQLRCWMLPHHRFYIHLLKRCGFLFWPKRYLPGLLRYTTPFIIRPRPGGQLALDPARLENWFITMGDHDDY
jgi:GNAT superfamily N-acetyltransferase